MVGGRVGVGDIPSPQTLEDRLTLFKPGVADYAHQITTCPPLPQIFKTSYDPAINNKVNWTGVNTNLMDSYMRPHWMNE